MNVIIELEGLYVNDLKKSLKSFDFKFSANGNINHWATAGNGKFNGDITKSIMIYYYYTKRVKLSKFDF